MKRTEEIIENVKKVGKFVCSSCVGAAVCGIGRAVLPPGVNAVVKGSMLVGGLLIGGLLGEQVDAYVDRQVDQTVKEVKDISSEIKHNVAVLKDKEQETAE